MAATVYLQEFNGVAPGVATSKQNEGIQFKSADDSTVEAYNGATAPLVKPNAGVYRSYEKYLQAYIEDLDGSDDIRNLQVFISGTPPDGGVGIFAKIVEAYVEPLSGGYSAEGAMIGERVDLFLKTSDNPLSLGDGPFDTELASAGSFLVLQMEVYPSARVGATSNYNMVFRYDETI